MHFSVPPLVTLSRPRACRYIWVDANGVFHALAHAFTPFYGVHAYVHPKDVPKDWKKDVRRSIHVLRNNSV